jgi:uncharacterized repeat protein (TIGR01451 family)
MTKIVIATDESSTVAGNGLPSRFPFLKRGGTHEISFEVIIKDAQSINTGVILNMGSITFGSGGIVPFKLETRLGFDAHIDIGKTVNKGHGPATACSGVDLLAGVMDEDVTYCFKVTNNGVSYLNNVAVTDSDMNYSNDSIGMLAPGQAKTVIMMTKMTGYVFTMAEATGVPVYPNTQNPLPGIDVVRATNDAGVEIVGRLRMRRIGCVSKQASSVFGSF